MEKKPLLPVMVRTSSPPPPRVPDQSFIFVEGKLIPPFFCFFWCSNLWMDLTFYACRKALYIGLDLTKGRVLPVTFSHCQFPCDNVPWVSLSHQEQDLGLFVTTVRTGKQGSPIRVMQLASISGDFPMESKPCTGFGWFCGGAIHGFTALITLQQAHVGVGAS